MVISVINVDGLGVAYAQAEVATVNVDYMKYTSDIAPYYELTSCEGAIVFGAGCTVLGETGQETWYVVNKSVRITERITVNGTVNLILGDGCRLIAEKGVTVLNGNILKIYGQENGTGKLTATGVDNCAGIGGTAGNDTGNIYIYGGHINAAGGSYAAGIGGGGGQGGNIINIYNGVINAGR